MSSDLLAASEAPAWNGWRWQMRAAARTPEALSLWLRLSDDERAGLRETRGHFRFAATPYYLSLADRDDPFCPVRMQIVPVRAEARLRSGELRDPLGEDEHRPVEAVIHKYPDRVLLMALDTCPVYCRHCTRRRITKGGAARLSRDALAEGIDYIARHPEVRDVLVSGGDPLVLADERLEEILSALRAIPHVEILRIGTRMPVCCPMRVDAALARMLRRYAPLFVVTHFNHPKEITPESRRACEQLVDHGVPVENQTVLLRRVNSSARILKDLFQQLLTMRVRPYYLHQMDLAEGCEHLRTPLRAGVEILEQLRGWTSGLAIPHLAVDLPHGGGKVTLQPEYVVERRAGETVLRNYRGDRFAYPEPEETDCACPYEAVYYREA